MVDVTNVVETTDSTDLVVDVTSLVKTIDLTDSVVDVAHLVETTGDFWNVDGSAVFSILGSFWLWVKSGVDVCFGVSVACAVSCADVGAAVVSVTSSLLSPSSSPSGVLVSSLFESL